MAENLPVNTETLTPTSPKVETVVYEKTYEKRYQEKFTKELELLDSWTQNEVYLNSYLKKYQSLDLNTFDPLNKQRFLDEINILFSEFKDFKEQIPEKAKKLREVREKMSCWVEFWKSEQFYQSMILSNFLDKRILMLKEAHRLLTWKNEKIGSKTVNSESFHTFKDWITKIDRINWVDVFSHIDSNSSSFSMEELVEKEYSKVAYSEITDKKNVKLQNGNIIDLEQVTEEYKNLYWKYRNERTIFDLWSNQLANTKTWFGFDEAKNWLWYTRLEELCSDKLLDIWKMWVADIVIMIRVLASIIPVAWDVLWWVDDFLQANA